MDSFFDNTSRIIHPFHIAYQAGIVGGAAVIPGTAVGAFYGTLRTQTPVIFAIVSGAQWFAIGATYWTARASILNQDGLLNWWNKTRGVSMIPRNDLSPTPSDKVRASTMAGAFTGFSLGFLFRGPRNVIPGTIMFTLFGWGGQRGYNYLDAQHSQMLFDRAHPELKEPEKPKEPLMTRIAKSKWSPMSLLSDEDYDKMLQERLLHVQAEIAIVDDRIDEFKKKAIELQAKQKLEALKTQMAEKQDRKAKEEKEGKQKQKDKQEK